jgi:hypothetical protein
VLESRPEKGKEKERSSGGRILRQRIKEVMNMNKGER